jgi:HPt (histidine-containing phosphotransfer) domain-containing protein
MNLSEQALNLGLDLEDYKSLVELFLQTTLADLKALEAAIAEKDASRVQKISHHIKGAAINLELHEIAAAAKKAERCGGSDDLVEASHAASSIGAELKALTRKLG